MKYFLSLVLTFCYVSAISQEVPYRPVQFGQFFNTYSILNPASCSFRDKLELFSARQQHGGARKYLTTTFVSGSVRFNDDKPNKFQVAGLAFVADSEGQYLKRSRAYFTYGWHTRLSKKLSLGTGVSAGFFSYRVSSSNASVSGSATNIDASLGVWLYSTAYYLGVSGNQILNSEVTPLRETTALIRHTNAMGGYTFDVNKAFTITPQFIIRYAEDLPLDIDLATTGTVNNIVVAGINYRHHKSIVPMIGFQKVNIGKGTAKVMFSYSVPAGKIADNMRTYELMLGYQVKPARKKTKGKSKVTSLRN
jgi:type IX secretion system PorP/SprF family membrane protein